MLYAQTIHKVWTVVDARGAGSHDSSLKYLAGEEPCIFRKVFLIFINYERIRMSEGAGYAMDLFRTAYLRISGSQYEHYSATVILAEKLPEYPVTRLTR